MLTLLTARRLTFTVEKGGGKQQLNCNIPFFSFSSLIWSQEIANMRLITQEGASIIRFRNSSLDFTPKRGFTTTTKPMKRKETNNASQSTVPSQGQRNFSSRARGGSGPPPQSYSMLADLDGLDEAEILQALYDNPHLAREAAQLVESRDSNKLDGKPSRSTNGARSATKKPRSGSRGPRHSREDLQQQEVPVFQWIVLFLFFATVVYQLRKVILAPDKRGKKARSKVITPSNRKEKALILDGFSKEKKTQQVRDIKKAKQSKQHKQVAPLAKARKNKPKVVLATVKPVSFSPTKASSKLDVSAETSSLPTDWTGHADNNIEWETVTKDKPLFPIHTNISGISKTAVNVKQPQQENMEPSSPDNNLDSKAKTKKKKSKVTEDKAISYPNVTEGPKFQKATDQDEALAKKLQQEENMAAAHHGPKTVGRIVGWEEVPTRHGRREKETTK